MLIAQISDFHLTQPDRIYVDGVDTAAALRLAVSRIDALSPRPDLILVTGDIAENGRNSEYACASLELARLADVPRLVLPGNHDDPARLMRALLSGAERFRELNVFRSDCVIVCGHVHRSIVTTIGAATAISAPAVGFQTWLDLVDGRPALVSRESGGFLLHRLEAGCRPVTHIVHTGPPENRAYP